MVFYAAKAPLRTAVWPTEGKSSWWTMGGDQPEDLLAKPLADYARQLAE
jgi:hypothetical protein